MIDWCNDNQGFAMVLLTMVYVLATIAICIFNYKSAKATTEQTKELKRQFDEQNRAFLTVTMQKLKNGLIALCIENHGNKIARNINIKINDEFVKSLRDDIAKKNVAELLESNFIVGVGQKWHIYLETCINLPKIANIKMILNLTYEDDSGEYEEKTTIDFGQYNWALLNDSDITDICISQKNQAESLEAIESCMIKIAKTMEKK